MIGDYHIIVRNADGILGGKGGYEVLITYKYKTTTIWVEKIKDYEVEEQAVVFNYNQQRIITDSLHKYVWHRERERSWLFIWLADFLL